MTRLRRNSLDSKRCRRFRHKLGFLDQTDYIQVNADGMTYAVSRHGFATLTQAYDLELCLRFVAEGEWIELEVT